MNKNSILLEKFVIGIWFIGFFVGLLWILNSTITDVPSPVNDCDTSAECKDLYLSGY